MFAKNKELAVAGALWKEQVLFVFLWLLVSLQGGAQTNGPVEVAPHVMRVGTIQQPALAESSGLAASRRFPGVFWTHNDNEDPAFLFAINERGDHLGAFEVKGARLIDWEATAFDSQGFLYFADIGTNGMARSHSAIHRAKEPNPADRWGPASVVDTWYVRFPGEREDCESFFVLNGYGYLVTKYPVRGSVALYRFNLADRSESILLEFVTRIPMDGDVSDAALSTDNGQLALVTDEGVYVIFVSGDITTAATAPRRFTKFENELMEGGTFIPNGILVTGEAPLEVLLFTDPLLRGLPSFTTLLEDTIGFAGRNIQFRAEAFGHPSPSYSWRFNGQVIPGATSPILALTNLSVANAGTYEIIAFNAVGTVTSSAQLTVIERKADLRVTEVMSSEAPNSLPTADWWELTNFDTETVDLSGWKFNDSTGGLQDAFVIPSGISILPGESIVFIENLTADEFQAWWGPSRFGANVQIITYSGSALSFRASGDSLRLWDNLATNDAALAAQVEFGEAETGISFTYNVETEEFGIKSQVGVNEAFQAQTGGDVGSPGRIASRAGVSPAIQSELTPTGMRISVMGEAGYKYSLESSDDLANANWKPTGDVVLSTNRESIFFHKTKDAASRFYRVRKE